MRNVIDHARLTGFLRKHFALDWNGIHGASHWARVNRYARYLAQGMSVDAEVLTLFALLHDSCRESDHGDPGHGARAALLAHEMNGHLYRITFTQEERLAAAIEGHSQGGLSADLTVQVCWDADRLDLGRLGIQVRPEKLSTERALALIAQPWPYSKSPVTFSTSPPAVP